MDAIVLAAAAPHIHHSALGPHIGAPIPDDISFFPSKGQATVAVPMDTMEAYLATDLALVLIPRS